MTVLLMIDIVALAVLAGFYLSQRRMTVVQYCLWGALALLLPLLGPFLVITSRPGKWRSGRAGFPVASIRGIPPHLFALPGPRRRRLIRRPSPQEHWRDGS